MRKTPRPGAQIDFKLGFWDCFRAIFGRPARVTLQFDEPSTVEISTATLQFAPIGADFEEEKH